MNGVKVHGLKAAVGKMNAPRLVGSPVRRMLDRWAIGTQGRAREKAPVDMGRLRNSIAKEIDPSPLPRWARVGTNVHYAPAMEGGTGLLADLPGGSGVRHWPPGNPLDPWARRKGFASGHQVAGIIGRRGGLRPRRYLRGAAEESRPRIPGLVARCAREIESEASRGIGHAAD